MFPARTHALQRFLSIVGILGLLLGQAAPVVHAQGGSTVYLPLIGSGVAAPGEPGVLFRTQVTVRTAAQWRDLAALGVAVLQQGDDWALVLADDEQLEALARLRYNPDRTSDLASLAAANGLEDDSLAGLLAQAEALRQLTKAATAADAARASLRAAMAVLPAGTQASLATAVLHRLLHHATTLNIKGESYRLKEKRRAGLLGRFQPADEAEPVPTGEEG